jgi:hypothetical protein
MGEEVARFRAQWNALTGPENIGLEIQDLKYRAADMG